MRFASSYRSPLSFGYLFTGDSGSNRKATISLICCSLSTLLTPKRGMFGAGEHGLRVVDLGEGVLDFLRIVFAVLAVIGQARPERAVADFLLLHLMAGVAVAAGDGVGRIENWPPRPLLAIFAPSFQLPRNLPSAGYTTRASSRAVILSASALGTSL